jgi:heat shock protein 4
MHSAVGIDFGSSRTVIGVVQKGGVEVICNESSYRETQNTVGYGNEERLLGDLGKAKMKTNYKNTVTFFNRVLNLDLQSPDLALERKHIFCKIVGGVNNKVAFNVGYQGENITVTPEQAMGAHFNKIVDILRFNSIDMNEFVCTYPNFFSQQEKESILISAKLAGVSIPRLVSETEANVKNYGIFRRSDIKDTKRIVGFLDFGHSKTSFYIAEFTNQKATVLYENHDRHLGARDIDLVFYKRYCEKFEKDTGLVVDENPKSRMRLLEGIEKQRKTLSANADCGCNVEYLVDEEDFSANLSREEFEAGAEPLFQRFRQFLAQSISESKINLKELHSVEIIGGATRIPKIQEITQEMCKLEHVSKTLNQNENCARGAAISSAEISTFFRVAPFQVVTKNNFTVKCKYQIQKEEGLVEKVGTLFKLGADLPVTMSVTLPKTKQTHFEMSYEDPVPNRGNRELLTIETEPVNSKHEDYKLIVRTGIDESSIIYLRTVELEETFIEEQKKPKEKKKDEAAKKEGEDSNKMEEEEFEIVKVKKSHTSNVKFHVRVGNPITPQIVEQWTNIEKEMVKRDSVILETNRAKNTLETLVYGCKDNLSSEWAPHANPNEASAISNKVNELQEWMSNEGQNAGKDAYSAKAEQINGLIAPLVERVKAFVQLADAIVYLKNRISHYSHETSEVEKNVSYFQKFKNLVTFKVSYFFRSFLDQHVSYS